MSYVVYDLRTHARTPVEIEAECLIVAGPGAATMGAVKIVNLSIGGCQIRARPGFLSEGCDVAIRFGAAATVRGMVCWSSEIGVGVRFFERLSPSLLQHLAETNRPLGRLRSVA